MAMVPTKGNLIIAKNTLKLCKTGYELLDKKRNILINEMMSLVDTAKKLQKEIEGTFSSAYSALQTANLTMGISAVEQIGYAIPVEEGVELSFRSVMGVELPMVDIDNSSLKPLYGFNNTTSSLDEACVKFDKVKKLTQSLAQVENSVHRLGENIKKTQKRANALKNIMIPRYEEETKKIQNALEEKEREEFSRLKVIKNTKED